MRVRRRALLTYASGLAAGAGCSSSPSDPSTSSATTPRKPSASAPAPIAAHDPAELRKVRDKLLPLFPRRPDPKPGDWLHDHPEPGQTFDEYLKSDPTKPTETRNTLAVIPLGEVSTEGLRIIEATTKYLTCHFGLPARVLPKLALDPPGWGRRKRPDGEQLYTQWLLQKVLKPKLPGDAAALIGFTATDLYPAESWNYVFGEASLTDRVGVWSLHRYGDPSKSPAAYRLALLRALKIAVHETGHMFSLEHCTRYACVQSGTNSMEETDLSPLWLCPDCLPKIAWVTATDPRTRLSQTAERCAFEGLEAEATFMRRALDALA